MARSRELRVQVVGDTSGLSRAFRSADNDTRKWSSSGEKHSKRFAGALKGVAQAAGISGAALGSAGLALGVRKAVDEMRDAAKVGAQTSAVIKSTGGAANVSAKQVSDLAERLSLVAGADDEVIQRSQNLLLTFTKVRDEVGAGNKIFTEGSKAIVDMAAAMAAGAGHEVGQADLKSATIQVGKALQDPIKGITALSRVGVTFTEKEKEKIAALVESGDQLKAQKIILGELRTEFKGSAKANADSLDRLSVAFDNLFEKAGEAMAPTIERLSSWLVKFIRQMQNGKGAGGDFVDSLKDIASTLGDIWDVAKKVPPEVYALMGITVAGVKVNRAFGGLPGKVAGKVGGGLVGGIASKATPVPVFVTNPGFGGPGGVPGKGGSKIPPVVGGVGRSLAGRLVPVVGAGALIAYVLSKNNRDLPTVGGAPIRRSADRTPSGGRNVRDDLAPSPNATRKVEGMGDALKRLAQRGRDLLPTIRKNADAARGFGSASDKMADAANRNSKRLGNLKDSSNGFRGAAGKAVDTANRLRDRIERLGGAARKGDGSIEALKSEIAGLKDKKIQLQVGLSIATSDFTLEPLGNGDGWGIEGAVRKQAGIDIKKGKINPFGFISGGIGGAGDLKGADPAGAIYAAIGSRFGLLVSLGFRAGSITSSGNASLHGIGRALDIAGPAPGMLAFARFLAASFGSRLRELIHTPMGFSIKNGARVAPYAQADHYDHVHVGFQRGGIVPGTGSGDKVTVGARVEPGEGLFVLNRNATGVLQRLNEMIPRFAKGGWARTPINIAADAARKAGFRGRDLVNMVAIAGRESTWNPRAANYTYPDHSIGLWQINQLAHKGRYGSDSALMNPYTNAKAAYALFRALGLQPWVGLSYGNASQHLDVARAAVLETKGGGTAARKGKGGGGGDPAGAKKPKPRLGAVTTYETDLARADRILNRAGDIDPTNKRDVAAVGGKLLLLGNRKAAIKRRLKTIRKALRGKLSPAKRSRLLGEQAQLISELGGIESTSRELHESMHPEAGEDTAAQAAEDQAAAQRELADQIKALKESIDEQNRITSSTVAIGLREAQRALADMISGEIGGLVGQRNRSPGDGMTAARY